MRILLVTPYFYPALRYGGPVRVAYDVSKELVKRGHEVTVYTSNEDNGCSKTDSLVRKVDGIQVHYFRNVSALTAKEMNLFITPEMIPVAKRGIQGFDVIHLHAYRSFQNMVIWYYARKSGVPYVLQAHGSLPRIMAKRRLKLIYDLLFGYKVLKDASKVIALARTEAQQYRYMGVPKEKIAVIPNGIDLLEYGNLPRKGSFKKKFNILESEKIILYLGRINKTKGIDFLVKGYARFVRSLQDDNVTLVIAGPDDGYLGKIKRLVDSLGIVGKTMFTGTLQEREKVSAYVDSDIVVNVEPRNVFGLVPLEAMACYTPVIVSKGNAISDIIEQGESGFSVKYGNVYELAETMRKMLDDNDQLREMGQKARRYVLENFDWTGIVAKFEKMYEEIIACKKSDIKLF